MAGVKGKTGTFKRTKEWKEKYPNCCIAWNKGLTKKTSESVKKNASAKIGRKHTIEAKEKMSNSHIGQVAWNKGKRYIQISGKNHWLWKGGISKTKRKPDYYDWTVWRKVIFERDNYTCQNKNCNFCNNKKGMELHPHHIKPAALFLKLIYDINNGITYCKDYHLKGGLHKGINKK